MENLYEKVSEENDNFENSSVEIGKAIMKDYYSCFEGAIIDLKKEENKEYIKNLYIIDSLAGIV